jgi:hypothetical protein
MHGHPMHKNKTCCSFCVGRRSLLPNGATPRSDPAEHVLPIIQRLLGYAQLATRLARYFVVTKTDRNKTNDDLTVLWLQTYKRLNSVYFICNQSTVNSSLALFLSIFVTPKYLCYIIISRQIFGSGFFYQVII